jgi:hypothetical protein
MHESKYKNLVEKERVKFGKELTAGRGCALLYGSTRQKEGTSKVLLREVNRRTNFSKSLTGRSSEIQQHRQYLSKATRELLWLGEAGRGVEESELLFARPRALFLGSSAVS